MEWRKSPTVFDEGFLINTNMYKRTRGGKRQEMNKQRNARDKKKTKNSKNPGSPFPFFLVSKSMKRTCPPPLFPPPKFPLLIMSYSPHIYSVLATPHGIYKCRSLMIQKAERWKGKKKKRASNVSCGKLSWLPRVGSRGLCRFLPSGELRFGP